MVTKMTFEYSNSEAKPGRKPLFLYILLGIIILAVLVGIVLYYNSNKIQTTFPADLAAFAPADSVMLVSLDIRPILENRTEFEPMIAAWKESTFISDLQENIKTRLSGLKI